MTSRKSKEHQTTDNASPKRSGSKQEKHHSVATQKRETTSMTDMSIIEYDTDLGEAEAPVPLPAGDYPAEIRAAEIKTSGAGNQYVNVTFHIAPEAYPADYTEGSEDGTILSFGRLNPSPEQRARWNMKKFCEAIGAKLGKTLDLNDWIGLNAIVTVVNEPYEGVMQANIKKVNQA